MQEAHRCILSPAVVPQGPGFSLSAFICVPLRIHFPFAIRVSR